MSIRICSRFSLEGQPTMERGYTLLELMVAVAIVAVLVAIAYPSYRDQIRKSRRADAESVLLQAAQWMERLYTTSNCYDNPCGSGTAPTLSSTVAASPSGCSGSGCYYNITVAAIGQNNFTLNATPATTDQANDRCKTLIVDNTGAKSVSSTATLPASDCWR